MVKWQMKIRNYYAFIKINLTLYTSLYINAVFFWMMRLIWINDIF